jgi:uncharacterized protein
VKSKLIEQRPSGRGYALVFDVDDDVLEQLQRFVEAEGFKGSRFYGVGGFRRATLAYYDMMQKRYLPIEVDEQVEVLSFIGNSALYNGRPRLHVHSVLGHRDGHTTGGHVLHGIVRPTLELMVNEIADGLRRSDRPDIGIPLLDP